MYRRPLWTAALLGLVLAVPAVARSADETKSDKPGVVLRFASLDHLRADLRYLAEVVGEDEKARQLDEMIKARLGDKGLEGVDPKKPLGIYGWVGRAGVDSQVVVLVPVADEKAFVNLVSDSLDAKPDKGNDGVYTFNADKLPAPAYLRFANDYAYATVRDKDLLDKDKLPKPAAVLPAGQGEISFVVHIDQIPDNLRELALGAIENHLAGAKDRPAPGATQAQKKFRDAAVDEVGAALKSLLSHGGETSLRLDLDREKGDLAVTARVAGKPGSPLADDIKKLGQIKSASAALLGRGPSLLRGELNVRLPEKLRKLLGPALGDMEEQALARTSDAERRRLVETVLKGIMPTLQAAELDTAIDMRGPGPKGAYTLVAGVKLRDGQKVDKSIREAAARYPKVVKLDAEKAGEVAVHRISPDKNATAAARRTLGDNPAYVAVRDDLLLLAAGEDGLAALREALSAAPTTGKVMELQMSVARLAQLGDDPTAAAVARKVFRDADRDADRLRVTVEGGDALTFRLAVKAKLLDYVNQVEKEKKK